MIAKRVCAHRAGMVLLAGLALGGLAGCANVEADQALYAQRAFVGMPKQTLLACAGAPDREARVDNVEYYTYTSERLTSRPALHAGMGWGWRRWGWGGFGGPYATEIESRSCRATFTLRDSVVERVIYGGATADGSGRLGQCYTIVENCLAAIPGQKSVANQ